MIDRAMPPRRPAAEAPWLPPPAPRARRGLTEADRALWNDYTHRARVAPMPGKALAAPPAAPQPDPMPTPAVTTLPAAAPKPLHRPSEIQVGAPPAGLDGKRWKELRRGRTRPERLLDLHGHRVHDAHGAVRHFLRQAVADGLRCVAIVTGKGSIGEGGVLRRELPHWLNAPDLRPLLLGAAHPHAANPGAVHLLLRRPKGARDR
jgi:DNA-nicking Smr family endonuclease